jgi:hypothetical protein
MNQIPQMQTKPAVSSSPAITLAVYILIGATLFFGIGNALFIQRDLGVMLITGAAILFFTFRQYQRAAALEQRLDMLTKELSATRLMLTMRKGEDR